MPYDTNIQYTHAAITSLIDRNRSHDTYITCISSKGLTSHQGLGHGHGKLLLHKASWVGHCCHRTLCKYGKNKMSLCIKLIQKTHFAYPVQMVDLFHHHYIRQTLHQHYSLLKCQCMPDFRHPEDTFLSICDLYHHDRVRQINYITS